MANHMPDSNGPFIIYDWGMGWKKKGVGHEVFFTEKGGPPKNISSEGGGVSSYLL